MPVKFEPLHIAINVLPVTDFVARLNLDVRTMAMGKSQLVGKFT